MEEPVEAGRLAGLVVVDGEFVHQLCDPNDAEGRTTGVVRAAVEEFWNDLKRAHWIDAATRSVTLTMVVASNSVGASMRYRLNFEFPTSGHVHASFDAIPMVTKQGALQSTSRLLWLALVLIIVFCVFELVELSGLEDGVFELSDITDYVTNVRMRKRGWSRTRQVLSVRAAIVRCRASPPQGRADDMRARS